MSNYASPLALLIITCDVALCCENSPKNHEPEDLTCYERSLKVLAEPIWYDAARFR